MVHMLEGRESRGELKGDEKAKNDEFDMIPVFLLIVE